MSPMRRCGGEEEEEGEEAEDILSVHTGRLTEASGSGKRDGDLLSHFGRFLSFFFCKAESERFVELVEEECCREVFE